MAIFNAKKEIASKNGPIDFEQYQTSGVEVILFFLVFFCFLVLMFSFLSFFFHTQKTFRRMVTHCGAFGLHGKPSCFALGQYSSMEQFGGLFESGEMVTTTPHVAESKLDTRCGGTVPGKNQAVGISIGTSGSKQTIGQQRKTDVACLFIPQCTKKCVCFGCH
jgi:hypothetical protein